MKFSTYLYLFQLISTYFNLLIGSFNTFGKNYALSIAKKLYTFKIRLPLKIEMLTCLKLSKCNSY